MQVEFDARDARAMLADLARQAPQVMANALNRALVGARTLMVREIARDMGGLKTGDVRERVRSFEARVGSGTELSARLQASRVRLGLIDLKATGPEPSRGKGAGVRYRLGGGMRRRPDAFIATMRSDHRGVFKRLGPGRLPIRELFGPSVGRVFRKFIALARARGEELFAKTLASELRFRSRR